MTLKVFLHSIFLLVFAQFAVAQQKPISAGGNASGNGGTVSYTVGQVGYTYQSGSNTTLTAGMQQTYIDVPEIDNLLKKSVTNVMSPNGDGKNDTWYIKELDDYPNNTVTVFDRAGRIVFTQKSYKNTWDGTYNGVPLAEGTYIYVIDLGNGSSLVKGTMSVIRDNR